MGPGRPSPGRCPFQIVFLHIRSRGRDTVVLLSAQQRSDPMEKHLTASQSHLPKDERPSYQTPAVVTYDEETLWKMLGPAQTGLSSTFGGP